MEIGENENIAENTEQEVKDVIPGYKSFEEFTNEGYKALMRSIKASNEIPLGNDYNFFNTNPAFRKTMNDDGNQVMKLMNNILRLYDMGGNFKNRSLEEKTELVIEANDNILERVAINIDEMNGIRKTTNDPIVFQTVSAEIPKVNGSWNSINKLTVSVGSTIEEVKTKSETAIRLLTAKNIVRPQTFFKDKIDNRSTPWEPKIKEKPNSLKPLAIFLEETERGEEFSHPYEFELDRFQPLPEQLKKEVAEKPLPIQDTPLIEITEPHQLDELVESLRSCKEFAVDLEHHSYRTFLGITCLMQISTRTADYLIDTLMLRDKLHVLNEVFTKPTIVKIFHGADMDIQWLQRDLSIYVVNMFDTFQAAKQLGYPTLSLAYLMNRYCNFVPDKQFQLADWRIRPLPDELKKYAREDTHYLIYIYQMMKNDLIEQANGKTNLLEAVIKSSTEVAKKRYFKPLLREDSHMDFYRRCKRLFGNRQLYALKELYKWRDTLSREEDESTGYVLPNHMLLQISETLPREMQGILACCNPIPPLVRANLLDLHRIILKAREQPLEKPIFQEESRARGSTKKISRINVDSPLYCPHDLSKSNEFRDDLPVLLDKTFLENRNISNKAIKIERETSIFSVFNDTKTEAIETENEIKKKLQSIKFLGPYDRYKLVKPFIQAQEKKEEAARAAQADKNNETTDGDGKSEEPTDEQRIEAIREHFLSLSRLAVPPEATLDKSLVQMGGRKKRKRDRNDSVPEEEEAEEHEQDNRCRTNEQAYIPEDFQTPIPNVRRNWNNKRKSGDAFDDTSTPKRFRPDWKKGGGGKRGGGKGGGGNGEGGRGGGKKQKSNNPQNQGQQNQQQKNQGDTPKQQNKKRFRNRNRNQQKNKSQQQNAGESHWQNDVQPYDYSQVDFRQYQGGASQPQGSKFFKSKFKPKGKKRGGNKGNRSATFGTVRKGTEYGR